MTRSPISKKVSYMGLMIALSLIFSYVEVLIPFNLGIPGVKLGLSNLIVLICLMTFSVREAMMVTVAKALIFSFLFGNMTMLLYSLTGAILSLLVMWALSRFLDLHPVSISAAGGVFHNIGQLIVAYLILQSPGLLYYVPVLLLSGLVTGMIIGYIADLILKRISFKKGDL